MVVFFWFCQTGHISIDDELMQDVAKKMNMGGVNKYTKEQ